MGLFDQLKDRALNGINDLASNVQERINQGQQQQMQEMVPPPAPPVQQPSESRQIYNQQMENLIEMALADGELTEKEKQVLFKKAEAFGIDLDEFEMVLDAKLYEKQKAMQSTTVNPHASAPQSDKYGDVKKCPSCGAMIESFTTHCPDCGYEFRNIGVVSSIKQLFDKIENLENKKKGTFWGAIHDENIDEQISSLIRNFPIPTAKEDILEFLVMAAPLGKKTSIFSAGEDVISMKRRKAWREKCGQIILKARFSMKDDKETIAEIEKYAKELKIK